MKLHDFTHSESSPIPPKRRDCILRRFDSKPTSPTLRGFQSNRVHTVDVIAHDLNRLAQAVKRIIVPFE